MVLHREQSLKSPGLSMLELAAKHDLPIIEGPNGNSGQTRDECETTPVGGEATSLSATASPRRFSISQLRQAVLAMAVRYPEAASDLRWLSGAMAQATRVDIRGEVR